MAILAALLATLFLPGDIGKMGQKPAFSDLFCKSEAVHRLSVARFFLFGARDVWFVVALPVFLEATLGWRFSEVGGFMGLWVIGYGFVQACAPTLRPDLPPLLGAGWPTRPFCCAVLERLAHRYPGPAGGCFSASAGPSRPGHRGLIGCLCHGVCDEFIDS